MKIFPSIFCMPGASDGFAVSESPMLMLKLHLAVTCFLFLLPALCLLPFMANAQPKGTFTVGFTYQAFGEVNENDAMAAVKAWANSFVKERDIDAVPNPTIFRSLSEIKAALFGDAVEALNMTADEFSQVSDMVADDVVICGVISGSITEEYVLLVNRKSNIKTIGDLQGRKIGLLSSVRASLAEAWLETRLLEDGLGTSADFFGQINTNPKVGDLLISLFFEKLDACVATRRGFDLMVELNPQTGQQLEILESSEAFVPSLFCFRKGYNSPIREQIIRETQNWHKSAAGRQSLTIFQTDALEARSIDCMKSAVALLTKHRELLAAGGSHSAEASPGDPVKGNDP